MRRTCVLHGVVRLASPAAEADDHKPPAWRGDPGSALKDRILGSDTARRSEYGVPACRGGLPA
jgi:hypothetical protein